MKRIKLFEYFVSELMLNIHGFPEKGYKDKYHGYLDGSLGYYHKCKQELEIHIKEIEDYINKKNEEYSTKKDITFSCSRRLQKYITPYKEMLKRFKSQLENINKEIESLIK